MKPRVFFFTSWDLFHMNLGLYRKVDREAFLGPIQNMWWSWSVIAGLVARTSNHPHLLLEMISLCDETIISQPPEWLTGAFYVGLLDGLLGVAGMMTLHYGSFPKIPCVSHAPVRWYPLVKKWENPLKSQFLMGKSTKITIFNGKIH